MVQAIDRMLQNPSVDHKIEHVLEKACRAVPRKSQKQCTDIVDAVGETVFNMISHNADISKVSRDVGMYFRGMIARPVF